MFGVDVAFNKPWILLLLAALPLLWVFSFRSISGLGRVRRFFALGLRSLVFVLLVFCLAEMQLRRTSERVTVIYVLDQSESIPREKRAAMVQYVVKDVVEHRNPARGDRAGVIVFGREAAIEVPPYDDSLPIQQGRLESMMQVRTDATNLESALKLAQASFSEDTAKRIVVALRALDPGLPLKPGIAVCRCASPMGALRSGFCTMASLQPGLRPAGFDVDGNLVVHCLDVDQPVAQLLADEEERFLRALGLEIHHA